MGAPPYGWPMTRIAVIGSGNIGGTIGEQWRKAGHGVTFTSRSPKPPETAAIPDAIASAEVVLLAVPGGAVPDLLAEHGAALDGRVVIDATNDVGGGRPPPAAADGAHAPRAPVLRAVQTRRRGMVAEPQNARAT